ncbi:MAG: small basic protein [Planctomycetes bacterium]|nr:small basic protein [Planctomycetota bacterium]
MSVHKSLRMKGSLKRSRNVLTRDERIATMKERGSWPKDGRSVFGLPKTRVTLGKSK